MNNMTRYYFQWCENVYGAFCRKNFVLLRAEANDYAALSDDVSSYLDVILKSPFIYHGGAYALEKAESCTNRGIELPNINLYIEHLVSQSIIIATSSKIRRNSIAYALEAGGLKEREWFTLDNGNVKTSLALVLRAFLCLYKVHKILKRHKILGVVRYLKSISQSSILWKPPSLSYSVMVAKALDKACLLYPKKTVCLPFAATLAVLLFKEKYRCDFVIGVQNLPFYAHAWVEVDGSVVNDRQELRTKLAPILKISPKCDVVK